MEPGKEQGRSRIARVAVAAFLVVLSGALLGALFAALQSGSPLSLGPRIAGGAGLAGQPAQADSTPETSDIGRNEATGGACTLSTSLQNDVSPPLASIPVNINGRQETDAPMVPRTLLRNFELGTGTGSVPRAAANDPVVQTDFLGAAMPTPLVTFEGNFSYLYKVPGSNNRAAVDVPDTEGDVGPSHYVQWVNSAFQIWDKTGKSLYGPTTGNTLFKGFGGPCETLNDGDPVVLYDWIADRWLMSQFALPNSAEDKGPSYQCVAISSTGDPLGTWNRYAFQTSVDLFDDYPKYGVWPDAYYMSIYSFGGKCHSGPCGKGPSAIALERAKMLAGEPASFLTCPLGSGESHIGPANFEGHILPPKDSPGIFAEISGLSRDTNTLNLWRLHVDWQHPDQSVFSGPVALEAADYNSALCDGSQKCIPQPGTKAKLDANGDRLMYRVAYRNFGDHDAIVFDHTVDADGNNHAGIRWYEIRDPNGDQPVIYQQGTYAPDSDHRWMGSIAMDRMGDIALGYSVSSEDTRPSIRYTGRLVDDPPNQLDLGESTLIAGGGSKISTDDARWGDYATMSVDPVDDCTFWFTSEYFAANTRTSWHTRIGAFRLPQCKAYQASPTATPKPSGPIARRTPTPKP